MLAMMNYLAMRLAIGEKEEGQGLVEYALVIALVAVACIGALIFLGDSITDLFEGINFGGGGGD